MSINDRIIAALNEKKLKQTKLAEKLGTYVSTVNGWLVHDRDIPSKYITGICEYVGEPLEYILTGERPVQLIEPPEDEKDLLFLFRELDKEGRLMVLSTAYGERRRMVDSNGNSKRDAI